MTASLQFSLRSRQCIQSQNSDSLSYNVKLKQLLRKLQGSLPGSKMLYANVYDPMLDMYVFFDSIHPTQKANELLAVNLLHQLASRY
ncbi:GDSL esterase/lipase At2g24560 [Linum perenne]